MTAHHIDTEALRREADDAARGLAIYFNPGDIHQVLDALTAAERRATRAEAQSAIRGRAVAIYQARAARAERAEDKSLAGWGEAQDGWHEADLRAERAEAERDEWKEVALQERAAALDALEQIKARDQRIQAVRDVLDRHAHYGLVEADDLRRALDGDA